MRCRFVRISSISTSLLRAGRLFFGTIVPCQGLVKSLHIASSKGDKKTEVLQLDRTDT